MNCSIFIDDSGEASLKPTSRIDYFGLGAVVSPKPEKIESIGKRYPKKVRFGKNKGQEYKYSTISPHKISSRYRAWQLGRLPANYFGKVLVKEESSETIYAYEVYRTTLHEILSDIVRHYPESTFELYLDYTTVINVKDLMEEVKYFPSINLHFPEKNSDNGGLRIADMAVGILTTKVRDIPNFDNRLFELIENKVVSKNIRSSPADIPRVTARGQGTDDLLRPADIPRVTAHGNSNHSLCNKDIKIVLFLNVCRLLQ